MKVKKENTRLEQFSFGDQPDDKYTCLINLNISPDGLDIEQMRLADPRNFDQMLEKTGCILMLTQSEVNELIRRNDVDKEDLHQSLYDLCKREKIID